MKLEYDLNVGALYIRLSSEPVAATEDFADNAAVDLDSDRRVVGIEVLAADRPWPLADLLGEYPISAEEAAQLRAYFTFRMIPPSTPPGGEPVCRRVGEGLPEMIVQPTRPLAVSAI